MNSIHRIGVAIAGLATLVVVAGAFVVQGYAAGQQAAAQLQARQVAMAGGGSATPSPLVVYVAPVPTPPTVLVTQTSPPVQQPQVIHVIVPSAGGDDGGSDH